jgi:uncharacterized protein YndB with AHSA1/START domain
MITEPRVGLERIEAEVRIEAPIDAVWTALTTGIGSWWPHRFADGSTVHLEPWVGGRFYEAFAADEGGGGLYASVTYIESPRILRTSGSMGLRGAGMYVKTFRLEPDGDATIVRTHAEMLGAFSDETLESYRSGNVAVLEAFKSYMAGESA